MPVSRRHRALQSNPYPPSASPPDGPTPGGRRPSWERAEVERRVRDARRLAAGAFAVALIAVGLLAWQMVVRGGTTSCQTAAWDTAPGTTDLPAGWTISASQYDVNTKYMRFLGPLPSDSTTSQASTDATITCYPEGAADAVRRTAEAITAAGQVVTDRSDLGDQAFSATDDAGNTLLQLRHGSLVVYLVSNGATPDEVDIIASAFDLAMGGDGGNVPIGTLDAGASTEPVVSESPSEAFASDQPVDPTLEAALPTKVGDIQLSITSETGDQLLGDDEWSRALAAALRSAGKTPADLHLADAYDPDSGLTIDVFAVEGMSTKAIRQFVLDTWLTASGAGVTQKTVTLSGVDVTKVDYGDAGDVRYVLTRGGRVYVIIPTDENQASQAVAALP